MARLDPRRIVVTLEIRGERRTYTDLAITVTGTKYASANVGDCAVTIANLEQSVSHFILTETSPFNRDRSTKRIIVEVGRDSTGLSRLFVGNIHRANASQPPDSILTIQGLTGVFKNGDIVSRSAPATIQLSRLAQQVADDLEIPLVFQAKDIPVANYSYTGPALGQVNKLNQIGNINAYIDNEQLIVKTDTSPLSGPLRQLSADSGMIGVPTFTEQGAKVTFLYDNQTRLGGGLSITSRQYPALTGDYQIYKLNYQIANRDVPFYYTAECRRLNRG